MNDFTTIALGCMPYWNHGEQRILRGFEFARRALLDHGHVTRLRIEHQKILLILRQSQAIGTAADSEGCDPLSRSMS